LTLESQICHRTVTGQLPNCDGPGSAVPMAGPNRHAEAKPKNLAIMNSPVAHDEILRKLRMTG
jgi:hypothetical protein